MTFPAAAIFQSAIRTQDRNFLTAKKRNRTIIQHIDRNQRSYRLTNAIWAGVNHGLLTDASDAFHAADTERILSNQIGMSGFQSFQAFLKYLSIATRPNRSARSGKNKRYLFAQSAEKLQQSHD